MAGDKPRDLKCILCDDPLVDDVKDVSDKCRESLRKASLKRRDSLHRGINSMQKVNVHNKCYLSYIESKNIAAAVKKANQLNPKRQRSLDEFDYNMYCIICYDDASDSFLLKQMKKPKDKRMVVHKVEKETTLQNLKKKAEYLKTKQADRIIDLIEKINLTELKEANKVPRYHHKCLVNFLVSEPEKPKRIKTTNPIVEHVMDFLENHKDECQFPLKTILNTYTGEIPTFHYICELLLKHHEDEIVIFRKPNNEPLICFKDRTANLLSEPWYEQKKDDPAEERQRVVLAAAHILLEDIRGTPYQTNVLPSTNEFHDSVNQAVPETLKLLLDTLCTKNKEGDLTPYYKKSTSLAHSLIKTVRPNSFVSPIQLGIASLVHNKTKSKELVNLLSNYGYTSSHNEVQEFEKSRVPILKLFKSELEMENVNKENSTSNDNDKNA